MRHLLVCLVTVFSMTSARAADVDLEKLLPEDTDYVVILDNSKLINSAVAQKHVPVLVNRYGYDSLLAGSADKPAAQRALKARAVEIKKLLADRGEVQKLMNTLSRLLTRVTVAGSIGGGGEPGLIILEGQWDKDYIEGFLTLISLASPEDTTLTVKNGIKVFALSINPGQKLYVTVASKGLLLLAMRENELIGAMERARGKRKAVAKPSIRAMVREIDPENALTILADISEQGFKIKGEARIKADVQFKLVIDAGTADQAMALSDASEAIIDQIRTSIADEAERLPALKVLLDATKRLKKTRKDQLLTFDLTLTEKEIDTLVKAALKPAID